MWRESREASEELSSLVRVSRRSLWRAGEVGPHTQVPQEEGRIPVKPVPGTRSGDGSVPPGTSSEVVQHPQSAGVCRAQQERAFGASRLVQAETSAPPQSIPTIAARATHGSLRQRAWFRMTFFRNPRAPAKCHPNYTATLGKIVRNSFRGEVKVDKWMVPYTATAACTDWFISPFGSAIKGARLLPIAALDKTAQRYLQR